ncbi:MAG: glycosyltransferase family 9 protein [Bacteroidota bacterium]
MQSAINTVSFSLDIPAQPWTKTTLPKRILAIRLQAMGDLVITLPYLQQLKKMLPETSQLDLLTREEVEAIPKNIHLFDHVYSVGGGRNVKKQLLYCSWLLSKLLLRRYDVVIDLQNNVVSRFIRKSLMTEAWSSFDRYSPVAAGECTRLTIEAIGLGKCFADPHFKLRNEQEAVDLLKNNGWDGESELVVLNPAGAFITRNWPMENYVEFAKLWLHRFPQTQFLVTGVNLVAGKAAYLKQNLGGRLIDLVNKTTPGQAFALIQKAKFVLSEDSGLMHMAWVSGIPTLALFGSTRSDRATPLGNHTLLLGSSDLECGNCMQETCKYGDTHCLTRYEPEFVFEKAIGLNERNVN